MNDLVNRYREKLNFPNAIFSRIDHDDAMVAVVYRVTRSNGEQFILKICDRINDYLRELHFLKLFADNLPVPRIMQVVQPEEHIHGAILMEHLAGALLKPKELTESLAYEIGRRLAGICISLRKLFLHYD